MRVTVIGAGVAGLACAVELAERGAAVEVLECGPHLGASCCSWFAGGMLAPWCELARAERLVATLGRESLEWWLARFPPTQVAGTLVVAHARDGGELKHFARRTERYEWLDAQAVAALEPDLAGRFARGLYFPEEGHLDPRAALAALILRLESLGARVRFGASASEAAAARGSGAALLDCTGLAARHVLTQLRGVKGEMLLVRANDIRLSRPVRVLHPRVPVYVVPRGDGHFMIGATMIESDQPTRISARSMLELLSAAYALHPAFADAEILEIGTGVRPAFADNLPRIERIGGTVYVNGLYRHGFLLAPALARRAAELLLEGRSPDALRERSAREPAESAAAQ